MQFLEKEKLNFEEYIKLGSKEDRLEVLKSHWNINEDVLQGKISLFSESDEYFQIRVIRNLDGKYILKNPFEERVLVVKAPKSMFLDDLKNLESDDNVIFRFTPNMHLKDRNNIPIHIIKDSIAKVTNIDLLYSENDFDIVDIIELIKNNEDMKISKVLVNEESFKKNAKEIYTNLYEEAESRKFELQLKNNELENQILENTTELNRIVEVIAKGIIEKQRLINLGILKNHNVSIGKEEKIDIKRSQYVDYIVKFLGSSYEPSLYYNEITIQKLYTALSTSQLVILSGSPGTGKTSLIEGFSDAIGANKKIISVQPNWTETQDLIGFYNPIDKKYISTPFLDFLVDAKNDEDRLYIVCLDEMNLAHVEYYFAEFLSKLESKDRELELYSEEVYTKTKEEIESQMKFIENKYKIINEEDIFNIEDISIFEKYNQLKSQYQNLLKYNHKLTIPKNIRFVGTINKDETTKNLSPKVVDRSFIMEVEKYSEETKKHMIENMNEYKENYNKVLNLGYEDFKVNKVDINEEILNELNNISNIVNKEFDISLNNRFYKQVEEIISVGMLREEEILDSIILTKIIPKINVYIESDNEEKIHKFEEAIKDKPNSMMIFNKMKLGWKDTEVLTFWR